MDPGAVRTTRVVLRDGRVALIGPLQPTDRERYLSGLERASEDSIFKRFMTPIVRLSEAQIRYLTDVDHRDHEALLAIDEEGERRSAWLASCASARARTRRRRP